MGGTSSSPPQSGPRPNYAAAGSAKNITPNRPVLAGRLLRVGRRRGTAPARYFDGSGASHFTFGLTPT
jgi:hypothetical protein